jgi:putative FmdB family regulatory protein
MTKLGNAALRLDCLNHAFNAACDGLAQRGARRNIELISGRSGDAMPIYAYACADCAHEFETLVRSDETPACPACGSARLERQLSLIAKPAAGGPSAAGEAACPAMSGGTPCGSGCPALGGMT